jgi:hypothetical protein
LITQTEKAKNPEEFRVYRQALRIAFGGVAVLGSLLLIGSIIVELTGGRDANAQTPTPADLLQCNDDVLHLLEDLADTPGELMHEAARGAPVADVGARWEDFSRSWDRRWATVNTHCRFDELADTGLGPAFDRMAYVHRGLPRLKLKSREMMKRWNTEQAEGLVEMRAALESSRRLLAEQAEPRGTP